MIQLFLGQITIMKNTILLLLGCAFIIACNRTRYIRVQVMRPAEVTISKDIQSVAILNRSIPNPKLTAESALTLEKPEQDKELSEECVRGLNDLLATSSRFTIIRCEGTLSSADPKSISFGNLLDWSTVDSICKKYNTEALLVLEFFDTDFSLFNPGATAGAAIGSVLNGNTTQVTVRGTATANAGWRVYYPKTKSILFEDRFNWKKSWAQSATNPAEALAKLVKKNEALMDVSYSAGNEFAMRIVPLFYWEDRQFYKGKKGEMQRAERLALAKDWESAAKLWVEIFDSEIKPKRKAKAAFNAALAYEVMGDLTTAQKWIQTAYVENGKDEALDYSTVIDKRIREQSIIEKQLPDTLK